MLAKLTARRYVFTLVTLFLTTLAFAQKQVTGKISNSADKQPIAGATVAVKGTNIATQTNIDGVFTLTVPAGRNTLVVSSVGYKTVEMPVGSESTMNISMDVATSNLDEVIVTGYTTQKVKEVTGSVAIVKPKDLTAVPAGQTEEMLQGRVAGLNVINTGQPGQGAQISLQGYGNFGDTKPLYIIDGVQGDINTLNPSDIESVQVLKDAGSAAIYGVRGANGVIVITTKRGKAGKPVITYDSYVGTQRPLKDGWGLLDTKGRAALYDLAVQNTPGASHNNPQYGPGPTYTLPYYIIAGNKYGVTDPNDPAADLSKYNNNYGAGPIYIITKANQQGTDWFHELFKPAFQTNHTLTASGGSDKSRYLFSLGYLDQNGTFLGTYLKRYTGRMNMEFNVKKNIRVGENLSVAYRDNPKTGILGETNIGMTYREQPIIPVYDEGGGFAGSRAQGLGNAQNPVANALRAKDNKGYDIQVFGNVYAEVDFLKYFTARTSFGGTLDNYYYYNFGYHQYENAENNGANSFAETGGFSRNYTFTNTIQFNKVIANDHSVKVVVGTEALDASNREVGGSRINLFLDDPNYRFLSNGSPTGQSNYSFGGTSSLFSYIGRLDYGYRDKYLFNATFRRDGSSVFGPNSRYGNFPAFSAAWRVTEEEFAKGISWLTDLKIRGSWGKLGFAGNVNPLNQFTLFGSDPSLSYYDIGGTSTSTVQGFYASRIGNPYTGWQRDQKTDVGLDAILWNGRLTISADYYKKKSNGLLFSLALPAILGGAAPPVVNVGDMENHGVEVLLGSHGNIAKDWKYDVSAAITTYKNNILSIPGLPYFDDAGLRNGNAVRNQVGHPISSFFGYKVIGLFQDASDVSKSPTQADAAPGRFKYADVNGDGQITADDRTFIGNPNPKMSLGLNIGITYKNFDFSTFMYGTFGNDVYNYTKYWIDFYQGFEGNKSVRALNDSWTSSRGGNKVPIQEFTSNFSSDAVVNSYYVEKGSYFRNKTIQLGYSLPRSIIQKAGIDRLRIYVQATNLFTFTKYDGLDPEVQGYSSAFGVDYGTYPANQKQYLVGLNVTF
ncbi:MAG TPA: TonB-dependent receptor [Chitinophagaceae bacterium]|nr:TonB-dependent receptor [Chitinophagaceae bacterium]